MGSHILKLVAFAALLSANFTVAADEQDQLRHIEQRGHEIFLRDRAAWAATDLVTVEALHKAGARGWVTERNGDLWIVRFIGECGDAFCTLFDVALDLEANTADIVELGNPQELVGTLAASWKARQLALKSSYRACSEQYNTVVIPNDTDDSPEWVVYLLAASNDPEIMIIGGHHKITVSYDGTTILNEEALSQSCLAMKRDPEAVAFAVTHNLHPHPIETHVFSSLGYEIGIAVGTVRGLYMVNANKIRLLHEN